MSRAKNMPESPVVRKNIARPLFRASIHGGDHSESLCFERRGRLGVCDEAHCPRPLAQYQWVYLAQGSCAADRSCNG